MPQLIVVDVGIDCGDQYDANGADLVGCGPDSDHIAALVEVMDRLLTLQRLNDAEATRAAIWDAMTLARQNAQPGDAAVLFVSSHGSTIRINGRVVHCLCPVDFAFSAQTAITADDLAAWIKGFKQGVHVYIWLDACFDPLYGAELPADGKMFPARAKRFPGSQVHPRRIKRRTFRQAVDESTLPVAYISACGPDETAGDSPDGGLFTCAMLARMQATPSLTARALAAAVCADLAAREIPQHPDAEGAGIDYVWLS